MAQEQTPVTLPVCPGCDHSEWVYYDYENIRRDYEITLNESFDPVMTLAEEESEEGDEHGFRCKYCGEGADRDESKILGNLMRSNRITWI